MSRFRFDLTMFSMGSALDNHKAAKQANYALDKHLKGLEQVYLHGDGSWCPFGVTNQIHKTALLFNVEELKPKECEHINLKQYKDTQQFKCEDCGKQFVAKLVEVF